MISVGRRGAGGSGSAGGMGFMHGGGKGTKWGLVPGGAGGGERRTVGHLESPNQSTPQDMYAGQQLGGVRGRGPDPLLLAGDWADHLLI